MKSSDEISQLIFTKLNQFGLLIGSRALCVNLRDSDYDYVIPLDLYKKHV